MPTKTTQEPSLPLLRQDIKIYRGPDEADGSPTYNLYDPIAAKYFKISWAEATLLNHLRPGMRVAELTQAINTHSTLRVTEEEVKNFFIEAARNNLLASRRASEDVLKEAELRRRNIFLWFIYHYLYFRVPLINPNNFLEKTLPYVKPLVSFYALIFYLAISLTGLFFLIGNFEEFLHTFTYFFDFQGFVSYALAIILVKLIHEFSHAYVAKYHHLYVPTMGVAVIVLWPVLYTDVTDGWKLKERSKRLAISFAGIAAELLLAGISTLGWALSEPGMLQSVFFVVSSVTWVSTLIINLNPGLRFDGYYLFCDITGIDNLQIRSFTFTRWQLRKWLLGLDVPCPEELMTPSRKAIMIFYSLYTWTYRVILYTTIAIFVYYKFTKALGIFLFLIEIIVFILAPIVSEAKQLKRLYPFLKINPRLITTIACLLPIVLWLVLPLPHEKRFAAITIPIDEQIVYVPYSSFVQKIFVSKQEVVFPGELLFQLSSPELDLSIEDKQAEVDIAEAQLHTLSLSETDKSFMPEKEAEVASLKAKLHGLQQQRQQLSIRASLHGTVYLLDDTLHSGGSVQKEQIIAKIAPLNRVNVMAFVPELDLIDIKESMKVTFQASSDFQEAVGSIKSVRVERSDTLPYPQLASINRGELPVTEGTQKTLFLVESYFPVEVALDKTTPPLQLGEVGHLLVEGPWQSELSRLWHYAQKIFWRESGM